MLVGVICGPTGIGKTELACRLAEANGFEILSADSRQIYKGMPIGTGQPTAEPLSSEQRSSQPLPSVKHHLAGFLPPSKPYNLMQFAQDAERILEENREKPMLLVGGTGMYIKALLMKPRQDAASRARPEVPEEIRERVRVLLRDKGNAAAHTLLKDRDPKAAERIHPKDTYRLTKALENFYTTGKPYDVYAMGSEPDPRYKDVPMICLTAPRDVMYANINRRVEEMVRSGWREEVRRLREQNPEMNWPAWNALGYREWAGLQNEKECPRMVAMIQKRTRNYAKKQITYFKTQFPGAFFWDSGALLQKSAQTDWNWRFFLKIVHESY